MGVATMYQELDVVDGLTIAENIFLGHELATGGVLHRARAAKTTRELLERLGHGDLSPHREVGTLSAAHKQIVSMARALSHDAKLIIMDEPSAVLDAEEVKNLFRVVHELTAQGIAIIYISHRLEEIRQIGDRITVIKDGASMASGLQVADTPTPELIRLMTGRNVEFVFPPRRDLPAEAPVVLDVDGPRPPGHLLRRHRSRCARARSSASRASSGRVAPRSSRPSTAPAAPRPARSP